MYTGIRHGSGTKSNVGFVLVGDDGDTGIRIMDDDSHVVKDSYEEIIERLRNRTYTCTYIGSSIFAIFIQTKITANEKESHQNFQKNIMSHVTWTKQMEVWLYIHLSHTYAYLYKYDFSPSVLLIIVTKRFIVKNMRLK